MIKTVFPTAYFGNIYYFNALCQTKNLIIEGHEHFVKQTLRTRCEILSANGELQLSIPVIKINGSKTKTKDIIVDPAKNWRKDHKKAIESSYSSAPYFEDYWEIIKKLIDNKEPSLLHFNHQITESICNILDLHINSQFSSEFDVSIDLDFRNESFSARNTIKPYIQVFSDKMPFQSNLSILDLIFCEGPMARKWLID